MQGLPGEQAQNTEVQIHREEPSIRPLSITYRDPCSSLHEDKPGYAAFFSSAEQPPVKGGAETHMYCQTLPARVVLWTCVREQGLVYTPLTSDRLSSAIKRSENKWPRGRDVAVEDSKARGVACNNTDEDEKETRKQ